MSVQSQVAGAVAEWVSLLAAVVANNPSGDIYDILARPDMAGDLTSQLEEAHQLAVTGLGRAWSVSSASAYRESLAADIERAYGTADSAIRQAAIAAFQSVPPDMFVTGVTRPGLNPQMDAARKRASEVSRQAAAAVWYLGLRNELTVRVARTRRAGEKVLAGAPEGWYKKWVSREDGRVCDWCRKLFRQPAIPLGEEFSYGERIGHRSPPRVYLDLLCPPRHPRCRCRIILVRYGSPEAAASEAAGGGPLFVPAHAVRAMPEDRYQALHAFHSAALHELGQVLRRHQVGSG